MRVGVCGVALLVVVLGSGGGVSGPATGTPRSSGPCFPVEVADGDGNETTIEAAPEKIVTSNASGLEMLLWLGAGKRVLGTGFPPGQGALAPQRRRRAARAPRPAWGVAPGPGAAAPPPPPAARRARAPRPAGSPRRGRGS